MSKKNKKNIKDELFDDCASANECTGMLQKITLDKEQLAALHRMFNIDDNKD